MKHYTLLLPLIATLAMSNAFAVDKPMSGPDMSPADVKHDMKDMKDMNGMKDMHEKCMEGAKTGEGMTANMEQMHKKCMDNMKGMSKEPSKNSTTRKHQKKSTAKPAAEHDHNHGAAPAQ
ncbi:hypothetical protein [Agitococcus lubricus]|uniref:Pentapeptide MXKDX repeat protein n=1 Tax=Agitococcus lubricus TaxID=1077255 RepID=A0A2T5IX71_9GAMM|nr:hypothetical protein [Agitococcus lubricus]PTQ88553.1 hypothetical protein C8N29_11176 [Agitococcus lubricus]